MNELWINTAEWKKPSENSACFLIPTINIWAPGKRKLTGTVKKKSVVPGDWCAGDFQGSETILYDTLMVDMWHSINTFGKNL